MTTLFNAPTTRIPRSGNVPVWDAKLNQWIPKTAPKITINGTVAPAPITQAQANTMTSTGTVGPYSITFSQAYTVAPIVVAWCGKESGGNPILINVDAISTTAFSFDLIIPATSAAINAGHTCVVEWIAIGT